MCAVLYLLILTGMGKFEARALITVFLIQLYLKNSARFSYKAHFHMLGYFIYGSILYLEMLIS